MCTVCLICRNTAKTTTETSTKINMVHGVHRTIGNDGWFRGLILAQHPEIFEANYGHSMALHNSAGSTLVTVWQIWCEHKLLPAAHLALSNAKDGLQVKDWSQQITTSKVTFTTEGREGPPGPHLLQELTQSHSSYQARRWDTKGPKMPKIYQNITRKRNNSNRFQ